MDRLFRQITPREKAKRVSHLEVKAIVNDAVGTVSLTDIMVQEGTQLSGYWTETREMLRKLREDGLPAPSKHFNAIVRGRQTLVIPNRGVYWKVIADNPVVVTTAIDFTTLARTSIPVGMQISHFYRTRHLWYASALVPGDIFEFLASTRRVAHNGVLTLNYSGFYHQIAAGNSRFNIDLMVEGSTIRPQPAVRILVAIQEWELASGGERM
ncbi:MAG: hypothetical protein ACLKAK_07350 [Alkaliphilus sp.]